MARGSEPNRKRQAHDARREKILAAVRTVCVQDGLSRLSVSAVAKHAGCTRSLFYHYFPTKEDAFDALIDESIDTFVEQLVEWNAQRIAGDIEGSLDSAAELLKRLISQTRRRVLAIALFGKQLGAVRQLRPPRRRPHGALHLRVHGS